MDQNYCTYCYKSISTNKGVYLDTLKCYFCDLSCAMTEALTYFELNKRAKIMAEICLKANGKTVVAATSQHFGGPI